MRDNAIEFRGTYRYASAEALERALSRAREHLDADELTEPDDAWTRAFMKRGNALSIIAVLPSAGDCFLAAALLDVLAHDAIDGVVEARRDGHAVDLFPHGPDEQP